MNKRLLSAALGLSSFGGVALLAGQGAAPAKPPAAKAAAKSVAASPVDSVIQAVKSGLSENLIIRGLKSDNKPMKLGTADLVKLQAAGVSENIIGVMIDPTSAPSAAVAAVAPAPPPVATPPPAPVPVAEPAPAPPPLVAAGPSPQPSAQSMKKRVVIRAFDFSAPIALSEKEAPATNSIAAIGGILNRGNKNAQIAADQATAKLNRDNAGKTIRTQFITRLADDGKIVVVERGEVEKAAQGEQDKNVGNTVKQGTGARIGQERGADAILTGDVTTYSLNDKTDSKGLNIGIGKNKKTTTRTAVVVINYRLVDAETLEIIATGEAKGNAERVSEGSSFSIGGFEKSNSSVSTNANEVLYGEATTKCIDDLSKQFGTKMTGARRVTWPVETTVALADGSRMTISAGEPEGVNLGEVFQIFHVKKVILDPVTKEVIDTDKEFLGEMTITAVNPKSSNGTYVGPTAKAGPDTLAIKKMPAQN